MPGKQRSGTVRPGWNVDADVAEQIRAGAAARGIPANDYIERAVRLVMLLQSAAGEKHRVSETSRSAEAGSFLSEIGLDPLTV